MAGYYGTITAPLAVLGGDDSMRCLACHRDGIAQEEAHCPSCGVDLQQSLREVLPAGTDLRSGGYRIEYALGQGGFGITYRAIHTALGSPVAIKEYFPQDMAARHSVTQEVWVAPDKAEKFRVGLERFYREGQFLAVLTHPNIVRVIDLYRERGTAYLVMEYLSGKTLREVLDEAKSHKLAPERVEILIGRLVDALAELHSRRIYHLDISPENVLLMGDTRPVLIDFGAARPDRQTVTMTRQFRMDYAPPEMLGGEDIGPGTDLYELAVMAHEMLTGVRPPPSLSRVMGEPWEPASLPGRWRPLLVQALELKLNDRPRDIRAWWGSDNAAALALPAPAADTMSVQANSGRISQTARAGGSSSGSITSQHPLALALARATPGSIVRVPAGTHRLGRGLLLRKAVTLVGEGIDKTELVADIGEYALHFESDGLLEMRDLSLRWAGEGSAHVARAVSGSVKIENCRFFGATADQRLHGAGLALEGEVRGEVSGCTIRGNGHGILVSDQAHVTLESNVCLENALSGIAFMGLSRGQATENRCLRNQQYGIYLGDQAKATLSRNTCQENRRSGIACFGSTAGEIAENACDANERSGILLGDQAQPIVQSNICQGNGLSAIAYFGSANGTAGGNTCRQSERYGIAVGEHAHPSLEDNVCQDNLRGGIAFFGSAAGTARRNMCSGNERYGISIADDAQPTLEANTCSDNRWSGLAYLGMSGGASRGNTCSGNDQYGIIAGEQSVPTLEGNICERNGFSGISYRGSSGGVARRNTCQESGHHGIYVGEQARPRIETNACQANQRSGICYGGNAAGQAIRNTCSANGQYGITAGETSEPNLEANVCRDNTWSGIGYRGGAAGEAWQNTCNGNGQYGVTVADEAMPVVRSNTCEQNQRSGIAYFGKARGVARQNSCIGNERYGISVGEQASPSLESNACTQNRWSGIAYFGSASGIARLNDCTSNVQYGISVAEQAQPLLDSNTCRDNALSGIAFFGSAMGIARQNLCASNLRYGIAVAEHAQPSLEGNTCRDNGEDGIAYQDESGGEARGNISLDNSQHGIFIAPLASPRLEDNRMEGNRIRDVRDQRR